MLAFNDAALDAAAHALLLGIKEFLAVPRTKQQIPKEWTQQQRDEFDAHWNRQKTLPRKQQEPRQITLKSAQQVQPMSPERARQSIELVITGVYQQTQVQQLCFDLGRCAYPLYSKEQSEFKIMAVGACLLRVLDEHCTNGGWSRGKDISEAEGDIAGYTKTWIEAPQVYLEGLTDAAPSAMKAFHSPGDVEPWSPTNFRSNDFIKPNTPESSWVLRNMSGGRSMKLALEAANVNQSAQYLFDHELYRDWFDSTDYEDEHSPQELRSRMMNRERVWGLDHPVSFRYTADSRLRLYATDTMSPQAGKTRSHFWKPCDSEGNLIETQMLDNTGSGFQIMSCISLDEQGAYFSNLLPNDGAPHDIYVRITQEALPQLPSNHPVAQLCLLNGEKRTLKKISKTASMAMLYGGGINNYSKGLVEFLGDGLPELSKAQQAEVDKAFEQAIDALFPHLRAAYIWMFDVLTIAVEHCENLTITVGLDHRFRTKKRKEVTKKISTKQMGGFVGELGGIVRYNGSELDAKGTARSYLAGIIQGLDACLLGNTVSNYVSLTRSQGLEPFIATTHDSYRIAAGDYFWLLECNRQSLRVIFSEIDVMERLHSELVEQVPEVTFPEPPAKGTFDLEKVTHANHILTPEPPESPSYTSEEVHALIGF